MTEALFRVERRAKGVVWLTLDRPEIHNAFDDRLIAELTAELARLGRGRWRARRGPDRRRQKLLGRGGPQLDAPHRDLRRGGESGRRQGAWPS